MWELNAPGYELLVYDSFYWETEHFQPVRSSAYVWAKKKSCIQKTNGNLARTDVHNSVIALDDLLLETVLKCADKLTSCGVH